ncbi:MAG: hypothetical protein LBU48_04535, partial [Coriobacteriales bacterium]|nr:hypothetical protein [Coriobacteriales bacterium]
MKRIVASFLGIVLLAGLVACDSARQPTGQSTGQEAPALQSSDMAYELADSSGIEVKAFNLGEGELKNALGQTVPCPLDGIIAVPQGTGPFPLVVLFHGVTQIENVYDTTYAGFDYLAKQLAAEGYATLSFNLNTEYNCFEYGES